MKKVFALALCLLFIFPIYSEEQSSNDIDDFSVSAQMAISNKEYLVTPGDVYLLNYAVSGKPISLQIVVDATYDIRIGNFGVVKGRGKTYLNLKKEVESIILKNYPMSGVQFLLVTPSVFKVIVKGEVTSVTEKQAWGLTRVSEILSGILTEYSSTRNIIIESSDGNKKTVDLFLATRDGNLENNPFVKPGDTITVSRLDRKVTVNGSVERPGTYEILPGENFFELVQRYGNGLTEFADLSRVEVYRVTSKNSVSGEKMYLRGNKIDDEIFKSFELQCYDSVFIASYSSLRPVMFIEGSVIEGSVIEGSAEKTTPSVSAKLSLNFNYGTNYAFFIRNCKSIFTSVSDLKNAYIVRKGSEIPINLEKILYDASYYSDLTVEENDTLIVPFKQYFVSVSGAVYNPGRYPYIPNRTYEYYISLAGGFIKSQNSGNAVKIYDIEGKSLSKTAFITPESLIEAKTNSFSYYFNNIGGIISTILSIVVSFISVLLYVGK